jgi:hypothetical protein
MHGHQIATRGMQIDVDQLGHTSLPRVAI